MNPFKYGQIVTGKDFCSRPELMTVLKKHVKARQNIYVEGERRIGKTSTILEVVRQMKDVVLLHIDLFQVKTINDVYLRMLYGISSINSSSGFIGNLMKAIACLKPTMGIDQLTGMPSISLSPSQRLLPENITGLLDLIGKKYAKRNLLVFFDEFQGVIDLEEKDEMLALMRSRIQLQPEITYVYAGSVRKHMDMIFKDPASPFYKSAIAVDVGGINSFSFASYITERFRRGGRTISGQLIEKIFDMTNANPGDVQEFCHALWDVSAGGTEFGDSDIARALDEIFGRERTYYESVVNVVTDSQLRCLRGIAEYNGANVYSKGFLDFTGIRQPGSVTQGIKRLCNLGVIYQIGRRYKFASPFFRMWLMKRR